MSGALRAKTPVPGLFVSGQDVVSPGIPAAVWGGVEPKAFKYLQG